MPAKHCGGALPLHPWRAWRTNAGMTRERAAALIGSTAAALAQVEQGHRRPSQVRARDMADATGGAVTDDAILRWHTLYGRDPVSHRLRRIASR